MSIETIIDNANTIAAMGMIVAIVAFSFWFTLIHPVTRELSADDVAELRELAGEYPTVARMVKGWMAAGAKLRGRHLEKAHEEAAVRRYAAEQRQEQASKAAEIAGLRQVVALQAGRRVVSIFGSSSAR